MGLQLLDFVELPLPSLDVLNSKQTSPSSSGEPVLIDGSGNIIQSGRSSKKREEERGSLFRTFLLGGSSALVASPCATPVLTSILGFVASAKNPVLGGVLLFGYTLGYATPLLIIASTGGKALVELRQAEGGSGAYSKIAPWVTPFTGGILLWVGMNGLLTSFFGDPSMVALAPVIE